MKKHVMKIEGMTCAACARRIERAVGKLQGVELASVNLAAEKLLVEYDKNAVSLEKIVAAVEKAGYKAFDVPETDEGSAPRTFGIKLVIAAAFCVPLLYIAMAPMITWVSLPFPQALEPSANPLNYALTQLFLLIPIMCVGYKFYTVGFRALFSGSPNMDSLIAVGTSASAAYSIYNTWRIAMGETHAAHSLYYESAGVIITLILLGKSLEAL